MPGLGGASELKQVLRRDNEYQMFFRCLICTAVFPIVQAIEPPPVE
jgi:hypothetical protein